MTVGLFEALDTLGFALVEVVKCMLQPFQLVDKVVAYVKDDSSNLATLVASLSSMVTYRPFGMALPHVGTCFGHAMSKACQYATMNEKVCRGVSKVRISKAQVALQKTITLTKNSRMERQEWDKVCIDASPPSRKLKTPVKTRFALKLSPS